MTFSRAEIHMNAGDPKCSAKADIYGNFVLLSFTADKATVSMYLPLHMEAYAFMVAGAFDQHMNGGAMFRPENDLSALIQRETGF